MTIGGSLLLIAAGAVLKWAVTGHLKWIDVQTTGTVLFIVGIAGLLVALVYTFWITDRRRTSADDPANRVPPPTSTTY